MKNTGQTSVHSPVRRYEMGHCYFNGKGVMSRVELDWFQRFDLNLDAGEWNRYE